METTIWSRRPRGASKRRRKAAGSQQFWRWMFAINVTYLIMTCEAQSNCEAYVLERGYSSVAQYMYVNAVIALFLTNFSTITGVPLMLRGIEVVDEVSDDPILKRVIGAFLGAIILCTVDYFTQAQCGIFIVVSTKYSPLWLAGFLVGLTMQFTVLWAVFVRTTTSSSLRCLSASGLT